MNYELLCAQLSALTEGVPYEIANLSNAAALLWQELDRINWAGFYKMTDGALVLYPFQGKPACIHIPVGKGVCGTAVEKDETIVVPDVHQFPGHIACDSASQSEIVIPIRREGKVIAVLDIDSPLKNRFTEEDREVLEALVKMIEEKTTDTRDGSCVQS